MLSVGKVGPKLSGNPRAQEIRLPASEPKRAGKAFKQLQERQDSDSRATSPD